jgi:hypothetical protein
VGKLIKFSNHKVDAQTGGQVLQITGDRKVALEKYLFDYEICFGEVRVVWEFCFIMSNFT